MTESMLLRLAMVLQNQAPSTLNKYICKLAEAILMEYPDGLSVYALQEALVEHFNLSFTEEEIEEAISKKGQNKITMSDTLVFLLPTARKSLELQPLLSEELNDVICEFVNVFPHCGTEETVSALLLKYLYFCFNSNVDNLLHLFEQKVSPGVNAFEATAEEITTINEFITWDNSKKNSIIYRLIAICYEYCMLTIKKDNMLSAELFRGKRFYLDANIIFRMAGINNEERKTVTQNFVRHCQEASIELYCTTATLDEIYRVVAAQVGFIKGIAGSSMPVSSSMLESINPNLEVNDFYKIYYDWCLTPGNNYGDYISFNRYLLELIQDTLSQLKVRNSSAYKVGNQAKQYEEEVTSLKNYKNSKRTWRHTSTASAETDITNIRDTLSWRLGTGSNIWQTNDFIVSADQLLISWTGNAFSGVPIVVLPSVWLSIILRFTGRTDDDYKSFCLFLTQRQHISAADTIDPIQLLRNINSKTTQTEIKEQIIAEIIQNKAQYTFDSAEDYDSSTDRAFDKVLEDMYGETSQRINDVREEMQRQLESLAKSSKEQIEERERISADAEREKTIVALSKNQAAQKVGVFRTLSNWGWLLYVLAGSIVVSGIVVWTFEVDPIYSWISNLLPPKIKSSLEILMALWAFVSVAIGLISTGLQKLIVYLGSESRENKLYKRFYKKNKSALS